MNSEQASNLLKSQQEIGKTIISLHERFGKENRNRRNKPERLLEWRGKFNHEWTRFLDNHDKLKDSSDQLKEDYYFRQDYYNFVKAYYQDGLTKIALQETLEKHKEGLPAIPEESPENVLSLQVKADEHAYHHRVQNEHQLEPETNLGAARNNDELDDIGFVTSIGQAFQDMDEHLHGSSTPKRKGIDKFLTLERVLTRKIDEIEKYTKTGLKTRARIILNDIEKIWNNFHAEMEVVCASSDEYEKDYYDSYQQVANRYYQMLEEVGEPDIKNRQYSEKSESAQVKLEPLKIPKFKGTYETWPTFSGLFETVIIANKSLTNVQRMQYLKSVVMDEADRAIASLSITAENFEIAWKILSERFDNKRAIIDNQITRMYKLERVQGNSAHQLRKFHDQGKECYALLKNVPGDQFILHAFKGKLDNFSRSLYQQQIEDDAENENIDAFFAFLHKRVRVLESMDYRQVTNRDENKSYTKQQNFKNKEQVCVCCGKDHAIYFCEKFKAMKINERSEIVKNKALCVLCLRSGHKSPECSYKTMCPKCNKKHNGLLHFEKQQENRNTRGTYVAVEQSNEEAHTGAYTVETKKNEVGALLATATIRIKTPYGWSEIFRVLIDQGSMMTFITERVVKILDLKRKNNCIDVCGIAGSVESSKGTVDIEITARYPMSFSVKATAVVLSKLTTQLPGNSFDRKIITDRRINDLILADPTFYKSSRIDLILGADIYTELIMSGMIKADDNSFVAQETEIGWILSGPIGRNLSNPNAAICMTATMNEIDQKMQKFWEFEEINEKRMLTESEKECLNFFKLTVKRGDDGVYSVWLPFKNDTPALGDSRRMAMAQFFQMERKFEKDPNLKKLYSEYIDEMIRRGYMRECDENSFNEVYYLPHHPVYKNSSTTKIRPVFDASRKTSNGISLNDLLFTGPRLQEDIFNILVRFRTHKVAFCADIEKMYLHVNLARNHWDYQRMYWRKNTNEPIKTYQLTTVTFGISSSPFLAVATMQHHAQNRSKEFPEAAKIIQYDTFMDDVNSGCDNVNGAVKLQREATKVLGEAGFPLRKVVSNSAEFMEQVPEREKEGVLFEVRNGYDKFVTTLGIPWFFESDKFGFKGELGEECDKLTKRTILSELLTIFDPLGLLSPVTIYNKILMQSIWKQQIGWDDEVNAEIRDKWTEFRKQLPLIEKLRAPRWLGYSPGLRTELIGFSDASEAAIGACVYLKVYANDNDVHVNLVAAKTKVAPMKQITLPRLELCAAELLTKLVSVVKTAFKFKVHATYYYSDSRIALSWIKSDPARWKTFVANRVSRIQAHSSPESWHYINTKANPADFASRGLLPEQLMNNTLWWHGPSVLLNDEEYQHDGFDTEMEEKRMKPTALHMVYDISVIDRFSSLKRAIRTIATCKRFLNNLRQKKGLQQVLQKHQFEKEYKGFVLTPEELHDAKMHIVKLYQEKYFFEDIISLVNTREVSRSSKLRALYPFTDERGILRVGGRLQNSEFSYNKRHPIIIPYGCKLMELIINDAHEKVLHGGNQITLAQIRHEFWIMGAKRAVKKIINSCITCHRFRKSDSSQLMGSLPSARTKIVPKAFICTGVDLCGPINLKLMKARGMTTQKGYIVIFVCMSTRAIHIEIVTDLTAEAFIAAFKRFIGRRGNVAHLYSDNGTNFIGASNILKIEGEQSLKDYNITIQKELSQLNTKFHFNPSLSPWMGGIWERGVGSIKYHLKRTIKNQILTYEQLSTVLIQIEAILNSRPISPLSENPEDLEVLTPGHFLVGAALTAPVEPNLGEIVENRLSDWQLCVRLKQEFWTKWSNDYITQLQLRHKWQKTQENLAIGDMVLVKEDNTPPLHWPLGRVVQIFPGKDDLVRVVEVLMKGKIYKRPIVKLAPLPKNTQRLEEDIDCAMRSTEKKLNEPKALNEPKVLNTQPDEQEAGVSKTSSSKTNTFFCGVYSNSIDGFETQTNKSTPRRWNTWKLWITMCLFFAFLITPVKANYTVTQFAPNTMAYVEDCENVTEITGHWNMAVHVNLDAHYEDIDHLHGLLSNLEERCKKRREKTICTRVMTNFGKKLSAITDYERAIKNKVATREKRGIGLTVLGLIIGASGTMAYNWIMDAFRHGSQQALLDKQTSVINLASRTIIELEKTLSNVTAQQMEEIWASAWLTTAFEDVTKNQRKILKMITKEEFEVEQIPVDVMIKQMELISAQSRHHQLFGENMLDQALNMYKLARVSQVLVVKNSVIVIIKFPLVNGSKFRCNKITPIPIFNSNSRKIASLDKNYVLIEANNSRFATKNELEMQNCLRLNENLLCELEVTMALDTVNNCILNITQSSATNDCITVEYEPHEFIKKLRQHTWLFGVNNSSLKVKCNQTSYSSTLNGSGILRINAGCVIQINKQLIYELHYASNEMDLTMQRYHTIALEGADTARVSLDQLKTAMNDLEEETTIHRIFHVHHTVILYVFIGWLLFCMLILCCRKRNSALPCNITVNS